MTMKKLLFIALLALSIPAYAAGPAPIAAPAQVQKHDDRFEKMRAERLERVSRRIACLQQAQACMQVAKNMDGLAACHAKDECRPASK